ncbi:MULTISPECIES: hypothetical protein [unclassified Bacillus (in: firmicutes)]|uniref:hypothetical protein n=1 Tax=Bacillaceae TaxID=186817 RepID=UPI000BF1A119|nr:MULTISPECIES: hypothetical protein [unclassified Bacillus (in: firmicutes)]PEJ53728.1 hypothetical protein CN692_20675 [Bacillus sp. AFS002410]PEL11636.1 hypothetical protein CN601_09500 [Bacillus sp. AFS017336]QKE71776.1 hypothetical protein HPK19_02710 [Arthrobacter citreus]
MNLTLKHPSAFDRSKIITPGSVLITKKHETIYMLVFEENEDDFPYVLISLSDAKLVQNYDIMPTLGDIEDWIGEITLVTQKNKLSITIQANY